MLKQLLDCLVVVSVGPALLATSPLLGGAADSPKMTVDSLPPVPCLSCIGCVGGSLSYQSVGTDLCIPPGTVVNLNVYAQAGTCTELDNECVGTPCTIYYSWSWTTPCDGSASYSVSGCVSGSYSHSVTGPDANSSGGLLQVNLPHCDCDLTVQITVNGVTKSAFVACTGCFED
jgi:hypothetical protein